MNNNRLSDILGFNRYKEKTWKSFRLLILIFYLILFFISIIFIFGQFVYKHDGFVSNDCIYIDSLEVVKADGSVNEVSIPTRLNVNPDEELILRGTIPNDVTDGMYLSYEGGKSFIFSIDGEERYSFNSDDIELPGRVVKSVFFPIPIYEKDAGKSFEISKYNIRSKINFITPIMCGYPDAIKNEIYKSYRLSLILSCFLATVSFVLILAGWYIGVRNDGKLSVRVLGLGIFLVSVWLICDSKGYQFLFNNVYIDGLLEYMISTVIAIPFIRYLNILQKRRYEKLYVVSMAVNVVTFLITFILHHTYILDYEQTRIVINLILLIIFIEIIVTMIMDCYKGFLAEYVAFYWGFGSLIVFTVMEVIAINYRVNGSHGEFVLIGLYILLIAAVVHTSGEIKEYEAERQRAVDSSLLKTNFLTNMSHEIRTPINTIIGMNEMIIRENKDEKIYKYSDNIKSSSELLLGIITDILDLSKIEAGKLEIIEVNYSTASLIETVKQVLEERATSKGLEYFVKIDESIPKAMIGDDIRIRQITNNLISNATKYTEKGSVELSISGSYNSDDEYELEIKVEDTGIGIKEEDLSHLFDTFVRLDEKRNKHIQGTGLGLAITKNLVDIMHGTICIDSTYGKGSSFTVRIPQKIADSSVLGDDWKCENKVVVKSDYVARFVAPDARILAVDDNSSNLMVITQYLKKTQVIVENATKGAEALRMCSRKKYDLILLDHMMPEMDGLEVMTHIKEDSTGPNINTPVIILTANAIQGCREEYLSYGFTDYLAKPINPIQFEEIIKNNLPKKLIQVQEEGEINATAPTYRFDRNIKDKVEPDVAEKEVKVTELIDRNKMITLYGDENFVDEIIKKVAEDSLVALDRLKEALKNEDYKLYAIDAHGIKGMMASIYCESMRLRSKEHEFAAKELRVDFIKEDFDKYQEEVRNLCDELLKG